MNQADGQHQNAFKRFVESNTKIYFSKETERKVYFISAVIVMILALISTAEWI